MPSTSSYSRDDADSRCKTSTIVPRLVSRPLITRRALNTLSASRTATPKWPAQYRPSTGPVSAQCQVGILASARRHNLRSPSQQRSIPLVEDQFLPLPLRAEMELYAEALKLGDDKGSALIGAEFAGWLASNCQRELAIGVLRHNNRRGSVVVCPDAVLTEGRIHGIADRNSGEDDVFDE